MKFRAEGNAVAGFTGSVILERKDMERLPCPFCGDARTQLRNDSTACYFIDCASCGASGAYGKHRFTEKIKSLAQFEKEHRAAAESAIERWNTRSWRPQGLQFTAVVTPIPRKGRGR